MKHDAEINILPYDLENIVIGITINEEPNKFLTFNFAVETDKVEMESPLVGIIPNMVAYIGEEFYYELPVFSTNNLEYSVDTILFDIKDNAIKFTPLYIQQGEYDITVTIKKGYKTIKREFKLIIE
ncbi:MAG: hypothetical protein ACMXYG_03195 [Candidatus Woesearchaeota archaeon]